MSDFYNALPFQLTEGQAHAVDEIIADMCSGSPMNRLLQGDVGSGKTAVAAAACCFAAKNGIQSAVMAPTEILAAQHFKTFNSFLEPCGVRVALLTGSTPAKQKAAIREKLLSGEIDLVAGTHAIIQKDVEYKSLGLVITDEQHRFGVAQRAALAEKGDSPHRLIMSATPIPRTLALNIFGDLDITSIRQLPKGRSPVKTYAVTGKKREGAFSFLRARLDEGRQAYVVCPMIEDSESELFAVKSYAENAEKTTLKGYSTALLHGRMKAAEKEEVMGKFSRGELQVLICTTVVEVGVDVPNATVMVIESAERFGLSQLHQLRGRVGRSNRRAFCYLMVPPLVSITDDARRRLKAIEAFSDLGSGFNIAMQDLDIRGAGNLLGAEQSGFITDMGFETYQKILAEAMEELGVETGISSKSTSDNFVSDCTIETDQLALIPDTYIDMTAEKIRIYKELDSLSSEKEMEQMKKKLSDRFGAIPDELSRLFDIVRIRQLGQKLGFEKIIIKNGVMIAFFIYNSMSQYYRSDRFSRILENISRNPSLFELKQNDNKLRIFVRNVDTLSKAYDILNKL